MAYSKWRNEFLFQFARKFPNARMADAMTLLKAATSEQRYHEIDCSINVGEVELSRLEKASESRKVRVLELCERIGARLDHCHDPRGAAYTLIAPDGSSVAVPGKGLPARCFR
jgi:hypothetical protein